jgi:hypothetical protein
MKKSVLYRTLQDAIFNSASFSSIATDENGRDPDLQRRRRAHAGLQRRRCDEPVTPADISDPQEVIQRALALSAELGTPIQPGFEALVFKASRGIEDIYELTYLRKDGSRCRPWCRSRRCATTRSHHRLPADRHRQHRAQAEAEVDAAGAAGQEHRARARQAPRPTRPTGQVGLPLQHEPRAAHAAQCHPGLRAAHGVRHARAHAGRRRSIEQILQAGWYLLELINEILDLALIESGKAVAVAEPVALAEVLAECRP